jgi:predicted glycosyltransferase
MIQDKGASLKITYQLPILTSSVHFSDPWLIYALGGGWGHLVRTLSLGRIAARHRPVIILCNSPYAKALVRYESFSRHQEIFDFEEPLPIVEGCYLHLISPTTSSQETRKQVREIILGDFYECVIVDTFPRGLGGELVTILPSLKSTPRILIHRDINPIYAQAKDLAGFVREQFNLVIVPGEGENLPLAKLPQAYQTDPWLIRHAGELLNPQQARHILKIPPEKAGSLILVCAAGKAEELDLYGQLTQYLSESFPDKIVRCLAAERPAKCPPELWVFHWPGIECLLAADVVVGGAGYNTFYECTSLGIPLVAIAFNRQYDRQEMRVIRGKNSLTALKVKLVENLETAKLAVQDFLESAGSPSCPPPSYKNGAGDAIQLIENLIKNC